jgi:hypothetical protein
VSFFPVSDWKTFGFELTDSKDEPKVEDWTEENIIFHLKGDVDFGFEKALDKRGISSSFMNEVVKMWLWILEDPLAECENYDLYGLPLLKATALKYGFENPIGDDTGSEDKYDE